MKTSKAFIIQKLKKYLSSESANEITKKNPEFASALSLVTENDLSFSGEPVMCLGHVTGNSTAVGTKSDNYSDMTRTISMDFTSDTYLFIDKSTNTTASLARRATLLLNKYKGYDVKYEIEAEEIAEKVGKKFCRESLNDLNYTLSEYRLNRYQLVTKNDFTLPVREIKADATLDGKKRKFTIGYWWIENGEEYVTIYFDNNSIPMSSKTKLIIGGICILCVLILLLVLIIK